MRYLFKKIGLLSIISWLSVIVPTEKNLILFGSYLGKRFGDNSGALFQYFLKHYKNKYRCIWLTDNPRVVSQVRNLGGEAYLKTSLKGLWFSLRVHLIISSYGIRDVLAYKPRRRKLRHFNLSHGVAFRKVLLAKHGGGMRDKKILDEQTSDTTYLAVVSQWNAEYQKQNIIVDPSRIRITGFPRNDIFYSDFSFKINDIIKKYNLASYNILYAPHWRKSKPVQFFPFPDFDMARMADFLREKNMCVILRPHMVDMRRQEKQKFWIQLRNYNDVIKLITIDEYTDVQVLMCLASCLITDYSSIQFDYLLLNKPIIYLPYDLEDFCKTFGGFHYDYEQFTPGPKPKSQNEFLDYLGKSQEGIDTFRKKREQVRTIVHTYQDGNSCRRVYGVVEKLLTQ